MHTSHFCTFPVAIIVDCLADYWDWMQKVEGGFIDCFVDDRSWLGRDESGYNPHQAHLDIVDDHIVIVYLNSTSIFSFPLLRVSISLFRVSHQLVFIDLLM